MLPRLVSEILPGSTVCVNEGSTCVTSLRLTVDSAGLLRIPEKKKRGDPARFWTGDGGRLPVPLSEGKRGE